MRRLFAALIIAVLAAFCLSAPLAAAPRHIPHEDPDAAEEYIDKQALLLYYSDILTRIAEGDYGTAIDLIGDLKYAHIPEEHRQMLEDYGGLINELPGFIASASDFLDAAASLIFLYRLDEAEEQLDLAQSLLLQMEALLVEIDKGTESVGGVLGVFESVPDSLLQLAYDALENSVGLVWDMEDELSSLRELRQEAVGSIRDTGLRSPLLTLDLSTDTACVGDNIEVWGILSSNGKALSRKEVQITVDGSVYAEAGTNRQGSFRCDLAVPFMYAPTITLRAVYTPAGKDEDRYLPAASDAVILQVQFYETEISLDLPPEIYPGMPFELSGQAQWEQPQSLASRTMEISLDDSVIKNASVYAGTFNLTASIGVDVPPGTHTLQARILPGSGYAGASVNRSVNVVRAEPRVSVDVPGVLFLPGRVELSGTVESDLPLDGAEVRIDFAGESVTTFIDGGGSFNAGISIAMKWGILGVDDLIVSVSPVEPWNADVQESYGVFVFSAVNILGLFLFIAVAAAFVVAAYIRRRRRVVTALPEKAVIPSSAGEPAAVGLGGPRGGIAGGRGVVLRAYADAVLGVERKCPVRLEPHLTMREYLSAVSPSLGLIRSDFSELTYLAERALYSSHEIVEDEAAAARRMASSILEGLKGGIA